MEEKKAMSVTKVTPVNLALVEFVDKDFKTSMILAAIAENIAELDPNSPELVGSIKVIDYLGPDNKWKNTGGVGKWLAKGIQEHLTNPNFSKWSIDQYATKTDEHNVESV